MGSKGARGTNAAATSAAEITDRLAPLSATTTSMFGGHGLFADGVMFAMVTSDGGLAVKADDTSRDRIEAQGAERRGKMPYWRVPASVMEDDETLLAWAREALTVAHAAKR